MPLSFLLPSMCGIVGMIGGESKNQCEKQSKELLDFLGLSNRLSYYPYQLSGGEQQRVSIARAVFNKPNFLLADEPTGNLDEENAKVVVNLFLKCQKEWNLGLIICSHDRYVCNSMKQKYILHNGLLEACKME